MSLNQTKFRRISKDQLPTTEAGLGVPYIVDGTGEIYTGQGFGFPLQKAGEDFKVYSTFRDLPEEGRGDLLYVVERDERSRGEINLYIYRDGEYHQIDEEVGLVGTKEVDETNIGAGRMLQYDAISDKLTYRNPPSGEGGTGANLDQVTKLDVVASESSPYELPLPIPYTTDFKRLPIEVLKFVQGEQNVIKTEVSFDNGDELDFIADEHIIFDGVMKLRTSYDPITMTETEINNETKIITATIDKSSFKTLTRFEVN